MKNTFVKIGSLVLVLVMSFVILCACGAKDDAKADGTTAAVTAGTASPTEEIVVDETADVENGTYGSIEVGTGMDTADIESIWEELCDGMTPEEIASCEKEFTDMGLSKEDVINLMYQ